PTKTLFYIILAEANLLKRLHHQFRRLVTDGARCNLEPVADRVILVSLERQRIGIVKRLNATLRHGERVVREVDLFLVFVPLVERKVDNPAKLEPVAIDQVQLLASARAGGACKGSELFRIACRKEAGVAITQAKLLADGFGTLLADILGDRARAFQLVAFLAPEDVAESGLPLALCPRIHAVAECSGAAGLGRDCPDFRLGVIGENVRKHLEARAAEM